VGEAAPAGAEGVSVAGATAGVVDGVVAGVATLDALDESVPLVAALGASACFFDPPPLAMVIATMPETMKRTSVVMTARRTAGLMVWMNERC